MMNDDDEFFNGKIFYANRDILCKIVRNPNNFFELFRVFSKLNDKFA